MAKINRFEEILGWQKARELTRQIYSISASAAFGKDWGLRDQIRRAAVSVLSNIAEGYERGGDKEFAHFLTVAKGSVGEIQSQLYVALDQQYLSKSQFEALHDQTLEISRLLSGLTTYLQTSELKGPKFRTRP
jgi:four helix bundle protein